MFMMVVPWSCESCVKGEGDEFGHLTICTSLPGPKLSLTYTFVYMAIKKNRVQGVTTSMLYKANAKTDTSELFFSSHSPHHTCHYKARISNQYSRSWYRLCVM